MERRGPSHLGPYGLACISCFKAKCKCVACPNGDGCQRCLRLKKKCSPSESIRRRTNTKKKSSDDRIAELENKLSDLISQLQSNNVLKGDVAQRQVMSESSLRPAATELAQLPGVTEAEDVHESEHTTDDDTVDPNDWAHFPNDTTATDFPETSETEFDIEVLLSSFRSRMLHHFPFIQFSDQVTAQNLRQDRPFVWRAIVCVASSSTKEKVARSKQLKTAVYEAMLGHSPGSISESMDLLLGLLIYISWGWEHVLNRHSLSRLMIQALALVSEMRLDKPIPQDARMTGAITPGYDNWCTKTKVMTRENFLERQRAVLACFVMSSVISAYFGEINALRWTSQMDEGLAAISSNKDCLTDVILSLQIRLQLLSEKAVNIRQQHQIEPTQALLSLTTLHGQLQEFRMCLSSNLARQGIIAAHACSVDNEINRVIHELSLMLPIMVSHFTVSNGESTGIPGNKVPGPGQVQSLWQCVHAAKSCTSVLLALSPSDFGGVSFLQWAQLMRSIMVIHHLTTVADFPFWDPTAPQALISLPDLLGSVVKKLQLAATEINEQGESGPLTQLACTLHTFRAQLTGVAARSGVAGGEGEAAWSSARTYGNEAAGSISDAIRLPVSMGAGTSWVNIH